MVQSAILTLATLYTLYFASDFFIPVVAAVVLNLVVSPWMRAFAKKRIPPPVTGAVIVLGLVAVLTTGAVQLSDAAAEWLARAPVAIGQLEYKLRSIKEPVEKVKEASEQVQQIAEVGQDSQSQQEVVVKPPSVLENLFGTMRSVVVQIVVTLVLLFFLISAGDIFKAKLVAAMPTLTSKKRVMAIWQQIERDVGVFVSTVTVINVAFGAAVAVGLYLIDMPNPLLWGTIAGLLNFVPYIGALVGLTVITVVAIITFDSLSYALLAPAIYVGLNFLEAQFLTPSILGNRLSLNAAIVFVAVIFWGWLWGVAGAVFAIPILIGVKTVCEHSPRLQMVAEFLTTKIRRLPRGLKAFSNGN